MTHCSRVEGSLEGPLPELWIRSGSSHIRHRWTLREDSAGLSKTPRGAPDRLGDERATLGARQLALERRERLDAFGASNARFRRPTVTCLRVPASTSRRSPSSSPGTTGRSGLMHWWRDIEGDATDNTPLVCMLGI